MRFRMFGFSRKERDWNEAHGGQVVLESGQTGGQNVSRLSGCGVVGGCGIDAACEYRVS